MICRTGALRSSAVAALVFLAASTAAFAQGHTDIIQGRVTTDSGMVLPGADVIITMAPDRLSKFGKTDAAGHYMIAFPNGTGDFLVHISALGRATLRKRVTGVGLDTVFTVNAKLGPAVNRLQSVNVTAKRVVKPDRDPAFGKSTGAAETDAGTYAASLAPDQRGDLNALAGTVPGVTLTPGGVSVLGLAGNQSNVTLDGMAFAGGSIPREAQTRVRFSTSTYDPARGGFSGAQTEVELQRGFTFDSRRGHLTLDAPFLQFTDPVSRALGQRATNVSLGAGGSGELVENKYYYNVAAEATRRSSDAVSLTGASPLVFQHSGVATDSVARLLALLGGSGALLRAGVPSARTDDHLSLIGRLDHGTPDAESAVAWHATGYLDLSRSAALGVAPLATPSTEGHSAAAIGSVQGVRSNYFRNNHALNETRSALTLTSATTTPYAVLPGGSVRVTSDAGVGGGTTFLRFGGNGALATATHSLLWQTDNATTVITDDGRHRLQLTLEGRLDRYALQPGADRYGSFTFNSLADVAAATPVTYTRTLLQPATHASEWSGFAALGDLWKPSHTFQLLYGGRLEANRFLTVPVANPAVAQAFGVRTDVVPNTVHFSPRMGFTWIPQLGHRGPSMTIDPLGTFFSGGGQTVVRGGVGEFRNFMPPSLLTGALGGTGLAGATEQLNCYGSAAPAPDWTAYAADPGTIPTRCADGSLPSFSDLAPAIRLFDPSYTAPRSWRGNVAVTSQLGRFTTALAGAYSINLDQPSSEDLNFTGAPAFTLAGEGGHPVFVPTSSVDPATGVVSPVLARRIDAFGHVLDMRSDGRSIARALTLSVTPNWGLWNHFGLAGSYTLQSVRTLANGFDAATFGTPYGRSWARGDLDVRHQIMLTAGVWGANGLSFSMYGRFASGLPYTPMIGSDVNGDGLANDRAFIFDPATVADPTLATGMRSLLAIAPRSVRDCLTRQLGHAAGRNSCTGPWTAMLNARVTMTGKVLHLGNRPMVTLNLSNPLGGLDQLLHGSNHLHGWGTQPFPDPVLYTVRGFDPSAQRFLYDVNPRFGDTRASSTTFRAPFRITLDVSVNLGVPYDVQELRRTLAPGRGGHGGRRLSADSIVKRYQHMIPDPYAQILPQSDSLLLSAAQTAALRHADTLFLARRDSVLRGLAEYLAGLGDHYDAAAALARAKATTDSAWKVVKNERKTVLRVLSPLQWRLLPGFVRALLDPKEHIMVYM